jgi:hypothetical protein
MEDRLFELHRGRRHLRLVAALGTFSALLRCIKDKLCEIA